MGDNSVNIYVKDYGSYALPFLSLSSIYKLSFISIPFVLFKILPGQASIIKNKRLRRDNSTNMQGRIMVLVYSTFAFCHLSIYQVLFKCKK